MRFLLVLFLAVQALASHHTKQCDSKQNEPWSYGGRNGPEHWGENFSDCDGMSQSPIEIDYETAMNSNQIMLKTVGYNDKASGILRNNGHAVYFTPNDNINRAIIVNGKTYTLQQSHFHFGKKKGCGSEHTTPYETFSMELHLVHRSDAGELAVVGILFREKAENKALLPITNNLGLIKYEDEDTYISGVSFEDLFPKCIQPVYFNYKGSLTTPPCSEGVNWFVMNGATWVSSAQMKRFRELYATKENEGDCPLAGNYRDVQPLNGRTVLAYTGECIF